MDKVFTYWSDLYSTELSEETNIQWVHAMPIGTYPHPTYGKLEFTPERVMKFAQSVKNKVRGIDPDVDYDHKLDPSKGRVASGWIKDADARPDGLWLLVEWTQKAKEAINNKEYRYFSPEYANKWKSPDGTTHEDVVLGGALTNRPYLKDLVPVNLHEIQEKENIMDRAELARILGLNEDASDDDIKNKLTELSTKENPVIDLSQIETEVKDGKIFIKHPETDKTVTRDIPKADDSPPNDTREAELAALAESNPAVAQMLTEHQAMQEDMKQLKAVSRLSEVTTQLNELGNEDKKALPPAVSDKFRDIMVQLPQQLSDKVADAIKELIKVGVVELGETTPTSREGKQASSDAISKYLSEVDKVAKEKEIGTREASEIVNESQPQLLSDYLDAVEAGQTLVEQE